MLFVLYFPSEFVLIATMFITFCLGFTTGAVYTNMYPCFSDVVDELVVNTGMRNEGAYNGIRTFFGRMAIVIEALAFAIVHILTNFTPEAETQPVSALWGIIIIMGVFPMIFYFIGFLVIWKVYDLDLSKVSAIQEKLQDLNL